MKNITEIVSNISNQIRSLLNSKGSKSKSNKINPNSFNKSKPKSTADLAKPININKKKLIKIIGSSIFVLILIGGGLFGYTYYQSQKGVDALNISMPPIKKVKKERNSLLKHKLPQSNLVKRKHSPIKNNRNLLTSKDVLLKPTTPKKIITPRTPRTPRKVITPKNNNINQNDNLLLSRPKNNKVVNHNNSLNIKNNNNIQKKVIKNKKYSEAQLFNEVKKPEKLLSEDYLPILNKDVKGKNDIYSLTDEELIKLSNMEDYITKKQNYMEKVSQYLDKKQKYLTALKTFDDFNKQLKKESQIKEETNIKKDMSKKIQKLKELLANNMKKINNSINKLKSSQVVVSSDNVNSNEQMKIKNEKQEATKALNKKDINNFFKKGQIFSMNNEYIVAVENDGIETVYKTNEIILDGFIITKITDSIITLEKNNQLYFYNIKNRLDNQSFQKVVIQMPAMYDDLQKDKNKNNKLSNNTVKEYKTLDQRKKEKAKRFFNINKKK